jgi:hypothetical protein
MGKLGRTVKFAFGVFICMVLSGCSAIQQQIVGAARQPGDKAITLLSAQTRIRTKIDHNQPEFQSYSYCGKKAADHYRGRPAH